MTKKNINEISKKLAGSYLQSLAGREANRGEKYGDRKSQLAAARGAAAQASWDRDDKVQDGANALKNAAYDAEKKLDANHSRKGWNRMKGAHNAIKRLTAEDLIPAIIDEDVTSLQEAIDSILRAKIDALFEGPNDEDDEDEDDDFGGEDDDDIEEEALDELSIDALKSYHKKAGEDREDAKSSLNKKFNRKDMKRINKRREGMYAAVRSAGKKALAAEEAEQVDELSKETLGSYATSRLMQRWRTNPKDKKAVKKAEKAEPYMKKAWAKAYSKNEEVEQVDELSTGTLNNYVVKAAKDQYKQANMHNIASKSRYKTKPADKLKQDHDYGESDQEFRDRQGRVIKRRANLARTMADTDRKLKNRRTGVFTAGKKLIKKDMGQ